VKLYLAGPLFTQAERRWLRELGAALTSRGHEVFLPQDDAALPLLRSPPDFHGAFEGCRDAIDRCEAVVAVLDGADADSGTAWECGYAYARGRPVLAVRTDFRGGEDAGLNLMLRRSATEVVEHVATDEDLSTLATRVQKALEDLGSS
jgi:nucleoside 2-deoxyribosyltransferase